MLKKLNNNVREIGNRIRELRKSNNISLDTFCEDINKK